ncbi:MAG: thioredoxin family protein [Sandaracinaceae bacterium]|nr:thioredoxin family protein [Sandaracinaceae bacterium]
MAFTHSTKSMALGTRAPAFELPATDGRSYSLDDFAGAKALVVIFTCNHCPVARAYEDRLVRLQADYAPRGAQLVAINPNDDAGYPEDSFDAMIERAREKQFNYPYLRDESQAVARAYDAACTPDVYVFDAERRLVYNGRIDDDWKSEASVRRRDLRAVLDAVLAGRSPELPDLFPAMGCSIKWKKK